LFRPREWWEKRLQKVAKKAKGTRRFGLQHEDMRTKLHQEKAAKEKFFGSKLWHSAWAFYHNHMKDRAEEKVEAITMTQDFMRLSKVAV